MDPAVYLILSLELLFALLLLWRSGCLKGPFHWAFSVLFLLLAFAARAYVFGYETLDYKNFLSKWVMFFRQHGGFLALKYSIGNYNIPYLYFLALFSTSDILDLYLIKLLSTFFDVLLAWSSMLLLSRFRNGAAVKLGCFFTVLLLPTVFLNSAVWGQCDSTYAAMLLLGIYLALDDRPWLSMVCAAVAFGFKLQAVFVLPVFAVLWIYRRFKWYHFLAFPGTYLLLVLPAVLLGRPFKETLTLYSSQAGEMTFYDVLNYNSSSFFAFVGKSGDSHLAARLGVIAAFVFMFALILACLLLHDRLGERTVLAAAALFAVGIPFLLPYMHERYFYCADVLCVVLAFCAFEYSPAALLTQFASLLGYHAYLKNRFLLPMRCGAAAFILVLVMLICAFVSSFRALDEEIGGRKKIST